MYNIKTCDDFVFTTKMTTVKEVVAAEQRSGNLEAKIAFHSMFDLASKDKEDAFGVKQDHEIFFIPAFASEEEGGQNQRITQGTLAGKLRPIPSRAHTGSWRHGLSSGLPWVWALSVRWSSSSNRATSLLARLSP